METVIETSEPMNLTALEESSAISRQAIRTLLDYERVPLFRSGNHILVMPGDLPRVRRILSRMPGCNPAFACGA